MYYDEINQADITDLRVNSRGMNDYQRTSDKWMSKLQDGTYRGTEGEWSIVAKKSTQYYKYSATRIRFYLGANAILGTTLPSNAGVYSKKTHKILIVNKDDLTYCIGDIDYYTSTSGEIEVGYIFTPFNTLSGALTTAIIPTNGLDTYIIGESTRAKSNTLTHTDIIGSPANYSTAWKQSGVSGVPLIVAEDGTSLLPTGTTGSDGLAVFKLSRDANSTPLQVLKSTDSGATWTALTVTTHYTFNTTTNAITFTSGNIPLSAHLIMVTYQTHTNMCTATTNQTPIAIGEAIATNGVAYGHLVSSLIGKVPTASTAPYAQFGYDTYGYRMDATTLKFSTTSTEFPLHTAFTLAGGALGVATVKAMPYLTSSNGKAYVNIPFKEMKHNGTSYGDDGKFFIADNVTTTTDNNALTILTGTKRIELPYFIGAAE